MQTTSAIANELNISFEMCKKITAQLRPISSRGKYGLYNIDEVRKLLKPIQDLPLEVPKGCATLTNLRVVLKCQHGVIKRFSERKGFPKQKGVYRCVKSHKTIPYYSIKEVSMWKFGVYDEDETPYAIPAMKKNKYLELTRMFNQNLAQLRAA